MIWLIAVAILIGFLYFGITSYMYGNDDYWPKLGIPFGEGKELGTFWERISFKLPLHELDNVFYKKFKRLSPMSKIIGIMEFRRPVALILDPDLIKNVMVKDFDRFTNRRLFGRKDDPTLFDKMLFFRNNQEWKDMRATLSPIFTTGKIRRMFSVFTECSEKMTDFLRTETQKSTEIDFLDVAGKYTMDAIASVAFGVDSQIFQNETSVFAAMGLRLQKAFSGWRGMFKIFLSVMLPRIYAFFRLCVLDQTAFYFLQSVVRKTMKHRESTGERRNDFLQLMMDTRTEVSNTGNDYPDPDNLTEFPQQKASKVALTDELIEAHCILFFLAGFDGTATLLSFAAYELALNPDVQKKLANELKAAVDRSGELNYESVNELEYLDMVVSETFRKYCVHRNERICTEDYIVPELNITLKKGQIIGVPVWAIHHDPDIYPEPERFIPERFTKENKAARNPYTYMPFGLGPRNCIGMRFAIVQGKAAIAHLVHNFEIEPSARTTIPMKYKVGAALKPADGMWLKVTPKLL